MRREPTVVRPLVLAVWQADSGSDPVPALASLPATSRCLVRAPDLSGTVPVNADVVAVTCADRVNVAAVVRRTHPDAAVVVLEANERPSADLAAALEGLRSEDTCGEYRARSVVRFLGREISNGTTALAWLGDPAVSPARCTLPGTLTVVANDVTASIAQLDEVASRAAAMRVSVGVGDFLWSPATRFIRRLVARARDGVPGFILSVLESYGEVLTAAKTWERMLKARADSQVRMNLHGVFERVGTHVGWLLVRENLDQGLREKLAGATPQMVEGERLIGRGRGGAWLVRATSGEQAVLRWYRRGGAFRRLLRDRYFGWRPRPVRELQLTEAARQRGVPAPEVLGARVDRLTGGFYRGALLSRRIDGASTLGELLVSGLGARERAEMLSVVGGALRTLHDCGVHHRDLNVTNVLVSWPNGRPTVCVIDFDRASLRASIPTWLRRRALRRLKRSFVKLGYEAMRTQEDFQVLIRAYRGGT